MDKKLLSIIIPCYNCEKYIEETINSLINQKNKNFEVIFIDDGSKDSSLKVATDLFNKSNLDYRILSQKNLGVSKARNIGINNANGKWIYFLDADDRIDSNLCSIIAEENLKDDNEVLFFDYVIENKNKSTKINNEILQMNSFELLKKILSGELKYNMCSFVVKKSIIEDNEIYFSEGRKYGEDHQFVIKIACNCKKAKTINRTIFYYVRRSNSAISKFTIDRLDSISSIYEDEKYIKEYYNDEHIINLYKKNVAKKLIFNINQMVKYLEYNNNSDKEIERAILKEINRYREYINYFTYNSSNLKEKIIGYLVKKISIYIYIMKIRKKIIFSLKNIGIIKG